MASVVIVTPHYAPETNAAARRITSLVEGLLAAGWDVAVVTLLPHYPQNRIFQGFDVPTPDVRDEDGVRVVRLRPRIVPKDSLPLRIFSETLFCVGALPHLLRPKPDLILATSPYMFLGQLGLLASRLASAKFVWDVRDLTWLYPKAAGKRTYGLDRPVEALMRWTARRADGLATATDGLLEYFGRRPERAMVFANGVSDSWLEQLLAIPKPTVVDRPVVMYAGLLGYNQNITTFLDVASLLPEIDLVIAGDGPERPKLEDRARTLALTNVKFLGFLSQDELLAAYSRADVLIAQLRGDPVHRWSQPSKLWEYLATGRPVVYAGEGDTIDLIERHGLAFTASPDDPELIASALKHVLEDPEAGRDASRAGRRFVDEARRRSRLVAELVGMLESMVGDAEPGPWSSEPPIQG